MCVMKVIKDNLYMFRADILINVLRWRQIQEQAVQIRQRLPQRLPQHRAVSYFIVFSC